MDPARDYRVHVGHLSACDGLWLEGGRNVVVVGAHVTIPAGCAGSYARAAVKIRGGTGTVHVEGLLVDGQASDGVVTSAPRATLQLENARIEYVHASEDEHADCVQTQAGILALRVDRLTCSTELQGIFLDDRYGRVGPVVLRNVDVDGAPGKHLFFQATSSSGPVTVSNVWLHLRRPWAPFGFWVYPTSAGAGADARRYAVVSRVRGRRRAKLRQAYVTFVNSNITGRIYQGRPLTGEFVPRETVAETYVSPGYLPRPSG
jgi:hypothetical protein